MPIVYVLRAMLGVGKAFLRVAVFANVVQCFVPRLQNVHHRQHGSGWANGNDPPAHESDPLASRSRTREACWPPFIGVLRGIEVARSIDVALMLHHAGFRMVSVTADTPEFERILRDLSSRSDLNSVVIGASSVTSPAQVDTASGCGARFISSTCFDIAIVKRTHELGLLSVPGVCSESQATAAAAAGGDILKVFPSTQVSPAALGAIVRATSDSLIPVIIAGGIEVEDMKSYSDAGASGFAVGSTLFRSEMTLREVKVKADTFMNQSRLLCWAEKRFWQDSST